MVTEFIPGVFVSLRTVLGNAGPEAGPVEIVHLFRFRDEALYAGGTSLPLVSGRDAYFHRYLPAIRKIAEDHLPTGALASIVYAGEVKGFIAGPADEDWDYVVVIAWPDFEHPFTLDTIPDYERDAAPHRRAALADFRVIVTKKYLPPGL
jgi:hypothetical protein